MEDYQKHVLEEHLNLSRKIAALGVFITSSTTPFTALSEEEQRLLCDQLHYMCKYHTVLDKRISIWQSTSNQVV